MSNDAGSIDQAAATEHDDQATGALGAYQGDMADYMSNVNSTLAAGNPFESKDYLEQQNLETSGAMDSANDAEKQQLGSTVAKTGTNSAALADTEAESARQNARDLTQYEAGRDTSNENSWLNEQQGLMKDQLEGANSEAGVYGTGTGAQSSNLNAMTTADDEEQQMWAQMAGAAASGAGVGAGLAAKCWIAAELYGGWSDPRTVLVRRWVHNDLDRTFLGRILSNAYGRWGAQVAKLIKTHRRLRVLMQVIFDRALVAAQNKYGAK